MKKTLVTILIGLFVFLVALDINAQTSISTSTTKVKSSLRDREVRSRRYETEKYTETASTTTTSTKKHMPLKKRFEVKKSEVKTTLYNKCMNEKMKTLTKEFQSRKKNALSEYKDALKSVTSTSARSLVRKNYNSNIERINKWFANAVKSAKQGCKELRTPTPISTSTTSTVTSTATSSQ